MGTTQRFAGTSLKNGIKKPLSLLGLGLPPGIDHRLGSLNGQVRQQEIHTTMKSNLSIARRIFETKSVINYEE